MSYFRPLLAVAVLLLATTGASAQGKAKDKSLLLSPPVTTTQTIAGGAKITIHYGQPSVRGRTIGKDLEPMAGKIWRAGANEATVFEISKPLSIEGKPLPAGKYAFFAISEGDNWTLIFNKTWKTWGAFDYDKNKSEDALRVAVKEGKQVPFAEKLTYTISPAGKVSLAWGDKLVSFSAATH